VSDGHPQLQLRCGRSKSVLLLRTRDERHLFKERIFIRLPLGLVYLGHVLNDVRFIFGSFVRPLSYLVHLLLFFRRLSGLLVFDGKFADDVEAILFEVTSVFLLSKDQGIQLMKTWVLGIFTLYNVRGLKRGHRVIVREPLRAGGQL